MDKEILLQIKDFERLWSRVQGEKGPRELIEKQGLELMPRRKQSRTGRRFNPYFK